MLKYWGIAIAAAALLMVGPGSATAEDGVTLLLKSGERVSGELASFDQTTIDIRDGSGQRKPYTWDNVVLLDFVSGARGIPQTELNAAREPQHVLIMKGGESHRGRVVDFVNEGGADAQVIFETTDQGRKQVRLDQVGRIYVGAFTAEAMSAAGLKSEVQTGAAANEATDGMTITVPGDTRWKATNIYVRQGERLQFNVTGTIHLRGAGQDEAQPAGAMNPRYAAGAPLPMSLAGALIGRIGPQGEPFGIGNQQMLTMPGAGQLYLGVNDDELSDNEGQFTVQLQRTATSQLR